MELPEPIELTKFIKPAKLGDGCIKKPYAGNKQVIAIGMGKVKDHREIKTGQRLRQAHLKTSDVRECSGIENDPNSIICMKENARGQRVSFGDSGEYLIQHQNQYHTNIPLEDFMYFFGLSLLL